MFYNVNEVEFLNILLVKVLCVKTVVAEYYAIWLIFEDNIQRIMQLIFPVLSKLWRLERFVVTRRYVEWVQFINIICAINHAKIQIVRI